MANLGEMVELSFPAYHFTCYSMYGTESREGRLRWCARPSGTRRRGHLYERAARIIR